MDDVLLTRRTLLRSGIGGGIALLVVHPVWAFADTSSVPSYLSRASYTGLTGDAFAVGGGDTLTLDAIGDLPDAAPGAADAFALSFSAPASTALGQGIRTLSHPKLGSFDVFVAAVDQETASRQSYELIVDRSRGVPASPPAAIAPAAVAPVASAPAAASSSSRPAVHHAVHPTVREATLTRTKTGVTARLEFAPGAGVRTLKLLLMHEGRTLASAHRSALHATRVAMHLRTHARRGTYDLLTITTDGHGTPTAQTLETRLH